MLRVSFLIYLQFMLRIYHLGLGVAMDSINDIETPNIDLMAKEGVLFGRAFAPAPVCSATRSAVIVGQSAIRF